MTLFDINGKSSSLGLCSKTKQGGILNQSEKSNIRLGLLGAGQLARYIAIPAYSMGIQTVIFTVGTEKTSCEGYYHQLITGSAWEDQAALEKFASECDVIILENEFVSAATLLKLEDKYHVKFVGDLSTYSNFDSKDKQKMWAQGCGIAVPEWKMIQDLPQLKALVKEFNGGVLKLTRGGYDGYGNITLKTSSLHETEIWKKVAEFLQKGPCLFEKFVDYAAEVAVVVVSDGREVKAYPVVETLQKNHICHFVVTPTSQTEKIGALAKEQAKRMIAKNNSVGLYAFEFFVTQSGELLFNEIAPRPHNSAHYTMEACEGSQFINVLNIALGQPLLSTELKVPAVGMLNLLGTAKGTGQLKPFEKFAAKYDGHIHLYGKASRPGRKMGHYTLLGKSTDEILTQLQGLQEIYEI